ncbi:dethiobiotin synthase [Pichia californica]|uniref:Dethiobiotin synthase n=1 Tax=Pichia californica TaxID=460514 RepID=A0A9P6WKW6_9ASCO|nr:dethiobiotin synthase [[Candida] californica]KAG0689025.1 dethiobiotin synthase [[Candida] californica]
MTTPIFITGTDTDIGKTFISALLIEAWGCNYWKPIQTGLDSDPGDTFTIKKLLEQSLGVPKTTTIFQPQLEYMKPLSPWRCTILENKPSINIEELKFPATKDNLTGSKYTIVEGAGGILVPINKTSYTTDIIKHLDASVIIVARSELGTLNHTLMTVEILKQNKIPILGVILNGDINNDNALTLSELNVKIIAQIPKANSLKDVVDLVPALETILS